MAFFENVVLGRHEYDGIKVWGRQLNPESHDNTLIVSRGSDAWMLGVKTEYGRTVLDQSAGSRTAIFGLMTYHQGKEPMVVSKDASLSLAVPAARGGFYPVFVNAESGGKPLQIDKDYSASLVIVDGAPKGESK